MSTQRAAVVSLNEVTKRYGRVTAVDRATFSVGRGEFFSLLGPSGCGKTTTLRLIAGFEPLTCGRLTLDGADVTGVPPYRRNVNTVFQQYALFPHLSVFDNVAFGPRSHGLEAAEVGRRVSHMLSVVRLDDLAARRPDELSGGQRQRVALARALVNLPSALLLDEPLSALDLKLREAMQGELKRIQREVGITFILVTHDQHEALTLSDRIAVMNTGRIEQVGPPAEIYDAPATVFVAGFVGSANLVPATVETIDGSLATVRLAGGHRTEAMFGSDCPGVAQPVTLMIRPERIRVARERPVADNALAVTVTDLAFTGPVIRCVLRDQVGNELIAHLQAEHAAGLTRNSSVWASWSASDCRLLPSAPPDVAVDVAGRAPRRTSNAIQHG